MNQARSYIEKLFGFSFPDDFYEFDAFLKKNHSVSLLDELNMSKSELFDVFEESFEPCELFDFIQKSRFYNDPPEFVTLFFGDSDGLHWGYYFDSPGQISPVVTSYYHSDAYELGIDGDSIFEVLRSQLEELYDSCQKGIQYEPNEKDYYNQKIANLDTIRPLLLPYTSGSLETGEEYLDKYDSFSFRNALVVAETYHSLGIVAPAAQYRSLGIIEYKLEAGKVEELVEKAFKALEEGYPATALQVAHHFWVGHRFIRDKINALFKKAYLALDRPFLVQLLEVAIASRQVFDKQNEERERRVRKKVEQFKSGMTVDFRGKIGKILKIEGVSPTKTATIQFDGEETKTFRLDYYAFHFEILGENE